MARAARRIPLSSWSDRGLHATAGRFQRLACGEGLTRQQDWLFTSIINELEWRYANRPQRVLFAVDDEWSCSGCELCRPAPGQLPGQLRIVYVPPQS